MRALPERAPESRLYPCAFLSPPSVVDGRWPRDQSLARSRVQLRKVAFPLTTPCAGSPPKGERSTHREFLLGVCVTMPQVLATLRVPRHGTLVGRRREPRATRDASIGHSIGSLALRIVERPGVVIRKSGRGQGHVVPARQLHGVVTTLAACVRGAAAIRAGSAPGSLRVPFPQITA